MNDLTQYIKVRSQIREGDVIAFSGRAVISYLIGAFSGSAISHVGIVRQSLHPLDGAAGLDVQLTESTIEAGRSGPQTNPLGETLANYGDGAQAWWLPLSADVRKAIDWGKFYSAIGGAECGVKYDEIGLTGFILRGIPILGPRIMQTESARAMFCSGLFVDVFEQSGVLRGINLSKTSPQDCVEMKLYREAVQIMGAPAKIARFNSI